MDSQQRYQVTHTARVAAPAARVYHVIADYQNGHPRILPPQFRNVVVERGGLGAGTQLHFQMRAFGRIRNFRHEVAEPEPGRVLVENDRENDSKTTFVIDPAHGGANVTITTDLPLKPGLAGKVERFLATRYLLGVYREEIKRLDAVAREPSLG
jgi:hypothetical protein